MATARYIPWCNKIFVMDVCNAIIYNEKSVRRIMFLLYSSGGKKLKVDINISQDVKEPYVVIHTKEMTKEISDLANSISEISENNSSGRIIGNVDDRMIILESETISVIRVDNEKVYVVSEGINYRVNRRMYELLDILGKDFMQVSKSASINLKYLKSVEPYFNGVMVLHLKDGEKEYISRKYVPELKKYLGI